MGRSNRESCINFIKELNILPMMSQCILSLLTFLSNNKEQYFTYSEIHNINTRHFFHLLMTHLNIYQKEFIIQILRFSSLSRDIKTYTDNPRKFKKSLKNFIH